MNFHNLNRTRYPVFKNRIAEAFYVQALKRTIWCRIEEEIWRRHRIESRALSFGMKHFFEELPSDKLSLSKKDLRFLKMIKVKV